MVEETTSSVESTQPIEPLSTDTLIEVLQGRKAFYLSLAGLYFKPMTQEHIEAMASTDFSIYAADEPLLEDGFNDITRFLRKRNTGTRQLLAVDWTSSFGGAKAWEGHTAIPNASLFLSNEDLMYREPRNKVYQIYKEQALRLRQGLNLAEDHISFELEFLSILSDRIIAALESNNSKLALELLDSSKNFIEEHILTWLPQLAERAQLLLETRFYRGVLKITQGYLLMDLQTIDNLAAEIEAA